MLQIQLNGQTFTVSGLITVSPVPPAPAAPSNLDIDITSSQLDVHLTWTNNAVYSNIEIWRSDVGLLAVVTGSDTEFHDVTFPGTPGYFEYTVRGIAAAVPSVDSNPAGAAQSLGSLALPEYSFPNLLVHFGGFESTTSTVTTIDFPKLKIAASININEPLVTLILDSLVGVTDAGISIESTVLPAISFPALASALPAALTLASNFSLATLSAPLLPGVGNSVTLINNSALTIIDFSALTFVGFDFVLTGSPLLNQLLTPVLAGVFGNFTLLDVSALPTVSLPSLTTISTDFIISTATALTSVTLTNLGGVGGFFGISGATSLATLSLPALVTVVGHFFASGLTNLVTVEAPQWVPSSGTIITFNGDALSVGVAASGSGVDGVLRRAADAAVTGCTISLDGGSNAPPTNGFSNADYLALIALGNTVSINAPTTHALAASWDARVQSNGGAAPSGASVSAISDFCYALDASSLTAQIITCNVFAPDSLTACLTPLIVGPSVDPWTNVSSLFTSGDLTVDGLIGNGSTKYLHLGSGTQPATAYSNDTGASLFVYESTTSVSNVVPIGGADTFATKDFSLFTNSFGTGQILFDCWNNTANQGRIVVNPGPALAGFFLGTRTASNLSTAYFANSSNAWASQGTSAGSTIGTHTDVTPDGMTVFCFNAAPGSGQFFFSNRRISFAGMGLDLTSAQGQALYDAVQALRVAFGGGFV